ncbi:MAG TPA: OmpA family protein [Polyangiaceae bacterium]|nr:OmpA family protein [Polyangiaceae bacterium]
MTSRWLLALVAPATLFATACVSQGKYDEAVRSGDVARAELVRAKQETQRREKIAGEGRAEMQKQIDDATAVYDELTKQLERIGQDSQSLLALNGSLKDALDNSKRRLDELRRAQAAAEARASLYRDLALRFKSMIDSGDLAITLRDGRMVLRLPNDVLFDSGRSELKPEGKRALSGIAAVLATIPGRQFQVAGHTDDEPIRVSPYKSNWDLSTARSLEVTSFLVSKGVDPQALSAAGYGEFDPIDTNQTSRGKSHNRRTEITLQPNIDELVAVPDSP